MQTMQAAFWVIVVLVLSMGMYITCWWRHTAPEPEQPEPEKTPEPAETAAE